MSYLVGVLARDHGFTFQSSLILLHDNSPWIHRFQQVTATLCTAEKVYVCERLWNASMKPEEYDQDKNCVCVHMVYMLWEWSNWLTVSSTVYLDTLILITVASAAGTEECECTTTSCDWLVKSLWPPRNVAYPYCSLLQVVLSTFIVTFTGWGKNLLLDHWRTQEPKSPRPSDVMKAIYDRGAEWRNNSHKQKAERPDQSRCKIC